MRCDAGTSFFLSYICSLAEPASVPLSCLCRDDVLWLDSAATSVPLSCAALAVAAGLAASAQRLVFAGRQLEDTAVLAQEGVADEDTLHILARLLGGGKKRKKKTYTKPKKQKHKHKKIKLRVLKFFKVSRPRACLSTCPGLSCRPWSRM